MLKRFILTSIIGGVFTFLLYSVHGFIAQQLALDLEFLLLKNYIFHFSFFLISVLALEGVYFLSPSQLGFSFLGLMMVKLGAFVLVFKDVLSEIETMPMDARLALIGPLLIYILLETLYCAYLLKKLDKTLTRKE